MWREIYNAGLSVLGVSPASQPGQGVTREIKTEGVLLDCWWQIVKLREIDYQTGLGWEARGGEGRDATSSLPSLRLNSNRIYVNH